MTDDQPLGVRLDPDIADAPPASETLTAYDEAHLIVYMRLLDAEAAGADWREVARIVLGRDFDQEPEQTTICWRTHLDRAQWMVTKGYRQLLDPAKGPPGAPE
jgi:hypothetical protein